MTFSDDRIAFPVTDPASFFYNDWSLISLENVWVKAGWVKENAIALELKYSLYYENAGYPPGNAAKPNQPSRGRLCARRGKLY